MPLIRLTSAADNAAMWINSAHVVAITQELDRITMRPITRIVSTTGSFTVTDDAEQIANKPAFQYNARRGM